MFDDKDRKIIRELIVNPRISDNQIGRNTGIPVKTVNRKRKRLEEEGDIFYFTYVHHRPDGTGLFPARQMYIVKFQEGLTVSDYLKASKQEHPEVWVSNTRPVFESHLGEWGGHLALMYIVEGKDDRDLNETFSGKIIPSLRKRFGREGIIEVAAFRLTVPVRAFHNYLFHLNIAKGKIKNNYPKEDLFVDGVGFKRKR